MSIQERLFALHEEEYAEFQRKLIPGIPADSFLGIRMPILRKVEKEFRKEEEAVTFLEQLPHYYYEENMLHGLLIGSMKDYQKCVDALDTFLPYVDNWAVCDTISPKVFGKHKEELLEKIREWSASSHVYTCRFGIGMLMSWFLDDAFQKEYLEIPAVIISEEYYVNMMIAWFFATALAKQWEASIPYLEKHRLGKWVHNKTIQKAIESYRITPGQKAYLKTLRVKS